MPAPNDQTLQNFEENIEKAAAAVVAALNLPAMRARQDEEKPPLSVAVAFTLGPATGAKTIRPGTSNPPRIEYSEFVGTLEIQIEANRPDVGDSTTAGIDDAFSDARARIRAAFMESNWPLHDGNLPYYRLSKLMPAGAPNGQTSDETDANTLRYDVKFCIKPDAWPTAS